MSKLVLMRITKGEFRLWVLKQTPNEKAACRNLSFLLKRFTSKNIALLESLHELNQNNVTISSSQSNFDNIQNHKTLAGLGLTELACQCLP